MKSIVPLISLGVLGVMMAAGGWMTLVWFPLAWLYALFAASNALLLPLMGLPLARRLGQLGMLRPESRLTRSVMTATLLCILVYVGPVIGVFAIWPALAVAAAHNEALLAGLVMGTIAILVAPLEEKQREDFRLDFYRRFGSSMRPIDDSFPSDVLENEIVEK